MSMRPAPADDVLALLAIAVGTACNAAFTMALFFTPPGLLDSRALESVPFEESAVSRLIMREPILMAGPEDERTGWSPGVERESLGR